MVFVRRFVTRHFKRIQTLIGIAVAVTALAPLGWQLYIHQAEAGAYITRVSVRMLCIAWGLAVLDLGILAFAWLLIVHRLKIALGFAQDLRAFFFSNFVKHVPGMMWYIAGRAYLYRATEGGVWIATTATVLENTFLLLAGLLLALVMWPPHLGLNDLWRVGIFSLPVGVILIFIFSIRSAAMLQLVSLLRRVFCRKTNTTPILSMHLAAKDILAWLILYILVWMIGGISFHCFIAAFYSSLSAGLLPFTLGVSIAYSLSGFIAFFVPAGMGVKELTGAYLLSHVLPMPLSAIIVLLFRLNLLLAEGFWLMLSHSLERWTHLRLV